MRPPTAQETQYKSGLRNIGQIVSAHARLSPDKIATRDSRRAFTFSQWNQRACRLANALTGLGLVKGDRVAVLAYNRVEWMEIYAALAKVGLVIVPLNFRLIGPEIGYIAEHCGARALIVQDELADRVEGMRGGLDIPEKNWIRLGDEAVTRWTPYEALIDGASDREPDTPVAPTDTWALMYTSGTTGKPKGVIRNHQGSALMCWKETDWVSVKMGCEPSRLCSITAANAAATTTPERTVWSRPPTISSTVKVTAAIGALKAAATPAAAPTGNSRRTLRGARANHLPMAHERAAHMCTVGPSRPSEAPAPTCRAVMTNFAAPSRRRTRSVCTAYAAFTCGMPLPRAAGNAKLSARPAMSPPKVGTAKVQGIQLQPDAL